MLTPSVQTVYGESAIYLLSCPGPPPRLSPPACPALAEQSCPKRAQLRPHTSVFHHLLSSRCPPVEMLNA